MKKLKLTDVLNDILLWIALKIITRQKTAIIYGAVIEHRIGPVNIASSNKPNINVDINVGRGLSARARYSDRIWIGRNKIDFMREDDVQDVEKLINETKK